MPARARIRGPYLKQDRSRQVHHAVLYYLFCFRLIRLISRGYKSKFLNARLMNVKAFLLYILLTYASLPLFAVVHMLRLNRRITSETHMLGDQRVPMFLEKMNLYSKTVLGNRFVTTIPVGSASNGSWKVGSDMDLVMVTRGITIFEKTLIYRYYFSLGDTLKMSLESAPCPHPPIWFASTNVKWALASILISGRADSPALRRGIKRVAPKTLELKVMLPLIS